MSVQSIDSISSRILFEDNHLIIINKLAGEIVQGDKTGDQPLLDLVKNYIKIKYQKPGEVFLGLVHRIDRPVSGAVIFAKTSKALSRMTQLIKNRDFVKIYLAITDNLPPVGEQLLKNYLKKNEAANKSVVVRSESDGGKLAELTFIHRASGNTIHLLEVNLHTGRHHQIRAQLAAAGLPIRGDVKYGAKRANKDGSISLHAYKLIFKHPVGGKEILIIAAPPKTPEWNAFSSWSGA
jgi:23S rRNA pseudouridine1911/1915/1917 synthase